MWLIWANAFIYDIVKVIDMNWTFINNIVKVIDMS